ncbi:hypothetical protein, partial [Sphingobium yanoikuyae]|uniref:hypothetical protein n=1 Tax=Sphingobium yanoikuyae TaxID=13690 RepID=UPI0035C80D50
TLPRLGSRVRIPSPAPEFFNKIKEFWPAGADRNRLFFLRKSQSKRMVSMFGARFRCAFSITVYQPLIAPAALRNRLHAAIIVT